MTKFGYKQTEDHKGRIAAAHRGKARPIAYRENISKAKVSGQNGMWKGDNASYQAKHTWIRNNFGTPKHCENCNGVNAKSKLYDWANIGGEYTRDRKDYIRLCRSCHIRHDRYGMPVQVNYPVIYIDYCAFDTKVGCYKPNYGAPEPHIRTSALLSEVEVIDGRVYRSKEVV